MKRYLAILIFLSASRAADLPDAYRTVERLMFVVPDADRAALAWAHAGVPVAKAQEMQIVPSSGNPLKVRVASAYFENVTADFVQPVSATGPLHEFLRKNKGGGMALIHTLPDVAALDAELRRLSEAGVKTLIDGEWRNGTIADRYVLLDTSREGKYVLGLTAVSHRKPASASRHVTQYAFVTHNLDAVSAYWAKLGLPAMTYSHPDMSDLVFRGKPGVFDMKLGWQRHGKVVYEWIQPLRAPSTYHEQLASHGEGFHHLAFNVDDMDAAIKEWEGFGFPLVMSGAWGDKGKPGSGRFAYHDLDACCGSAIELLWNYRAK